jgi:hypothetical protein
MKHSSHVRVSIDETRLLIGVIAYLQTYFQHGQPREALDGLPVRVRRDLLRFGLIEADTVEECARALQRINEHLRRVSGEP